MFYNIQNFCGLFDKLLIKDSSELFLLPGLKVVLVVLSCNLVCSYQILFDLLLGVIAARDATLTFMVGGSEENFSIAEKILINIGKNVVHCGAVGTGQVGSTYCIITTKLFRQFHIAV